MSKTLKSIYRVVLTATCYAIAFTLISILLNLFFEGAKSLNGFSGVQLAESLRKMFGFVLIAICINAIFIRVKYGKADNLLSKKPLSAFTKGVIYFLGLPLFGAIFSMVVVRLFQIIGVGIRDIYVVISFTLIFWGYGAYLCKTRYFNNT